MLQQQDRGEVRAHVWRVRLHRGTSAAAIAVGATRPALCPSTSDVAAQPVACAAASQVAAQRTAAAAITAASVRRRKRADLVRGEAVQVHQGLHSSKVRAHVWRVRLHWRSAVAAVAVGATRLAVCAAASDLAAQRTAAEAITAASVRGRKRADLV